jgi:hypothetical protein
MTAIERLGKLSWAPRVPDTGSEVRFCDTNTAVNASRKHLALL